MAKRERHPRITPMRAVELLRRLARAAASEESVMRYELGHVCDALESHIKAELTKGRR